MVDNYAVFFNCTPVSRASDSMMTSEIKLFILVGSWFVGCLVHGDTSVVVLFVPCFGVDFLRCLNLMYVFIFYLSSGN